VVGLIGAGIGSSLSPPLAQREADEQAGGHDRPDHRPDPDAERMVRHFTALTRPAAGEADP
jgi:hypothetical protein